MNWYRVELPADNFKIIEAKDDREAIHIADVLFGEVLTDDSGWLCIYEIDDEYEEIRFVI